MRENPYAVRKPYIAAAHGKTVWAAAKPSRLKEQAFPS
jgi:hypothetical protein